MYTVLGGVRAVVTSACDMLLIDIYRIIQLYYYSTLLNNSCLPVVAFEFSQGFSVQYILHGKLFGIPLVFNLFFNNVTHY